MLKHNLHLNSNPTLRSRTVIGEVSVPIAIPHRLPILLGMAAICIAIFNSASLADTPSVSYIFPAGGQRGTTVQFNVGGHYLHEGCPFSMRGSGIDAVKRIKRGKTVWFEGPLIPMPASQKSENYPRDYAGTVKIAADAAQGVRYWNVWTSQGVTPSMKFVVGDLPEVIEQEADGDPIPTNVTLPVTINGRIFPREDVDIWTFTAKAGQVTTCEVHASRLGSPLDSRLEIRGPDGERIAENVDTFGTDSLVRFTAPRDGKYQVRIHDVTFGGLQHYVYRLTITAGLYVDFVYPLGGRRGSTTPFELSGAQTPKSPVEIALPKKSGSLHVHRTEIDGRPANAFLLELDDLSEFLEQEPNNEHKAANKFSGPAVLNGRILQPGDIDLWSFDAKKDEQWKFDSREDRLGSKLDSVMTLLDSAGKQLSQSDSQISLKIPADGTYFVRIEDRFTSRGGPRFAYRLRITNHDPPDFRLLLPGDAVNINVGKETKLKINVERMGGFQDEIQIKLDGLPEGVTAAAATVGKNKKNVDVTLKAVETAKVQAVRLTVTGEATINDKKIVRRAVVAAAAGTPEIDDLSLAVTVPTPFKFTGIFETKYAPRGSVYFRSYTIDRGGYEGPIEISLTDRQTRHLQGVTGPTITLPPGTTKFSYPITLAPWMEIGRTSRTCLMAVAVVKAADGTLHKVSFSSSEQKDQIITLVDPGRLSVRTERRSYAAKSGGEIRVLVKIARGNGLTGPVAVRLVIPGHMHGIAADPIKLPADETTAELSIRFVSERPGPFNMPLTLQATIDDKNGQPITAETKISLVTRR